MSRAYGEPVNVQARDDGRPVRFVWRGPLYTVRAILEHWVVNREWWQDRGPSEAPRPEQPEPVPEQPEPMPEQPGPEQPGPEQPGPEQPELEFWRVEASPGQGMSAGVYELRREAAADAWTLRGGLDRDLDRCGRRCSGAAVGRDQDVVGPVGHEVGQDDRIGGRCLVGVDLAVPADRLDRAARRHLAVDGHRVPRRRPAGSPEPTASPASGPDTCRDSCRAQPRSAGRHPVDGQLLLGLEGLDRGQRGRAEVAVHGELRTPDVQPGLQRIDRRAGSALGPAWARKEGPGNRPWAFTDPAAACTWKLASVPLYAFMSTLVTPLSVALEVYCQMMGVIQPSRSPAKGRRRCTWCNRTRRAACPDR